MTLTKSDLFTYLAEHGVGITGAGSKPAILNSGYKHQGPGLNRLVIETPETGSGTGSNLSLCAINIKVSDFKLGAITIGISSCVRC